MAEDNRPLDEAPQPGGVYYREIGRTGKYIAVNANGHPIEDAPPRPADTPRTNQPNAPLAAGAPAAGGIDIHALGHAIGQAIVGASSGAQANTGTSAGSAGASTSSRSSARGNGGKAPETVKPSDVGTNPEALAAAGPGADSNTPSNTGSDANASS